jgi:hypothetical protein
MKPHSVQCVRCDESFDTDDIENKYVFCPHCNKKTHNIIPFVAKISNEVFPFPENVDPFEDTILGGKCSKCDKNHKELPHTCPYSEEINDNHDLCDCCHDCEHECSMDI